MPTRSWFVQKGAAMRATKITIGVSIFGYLGIATIAVCEILERRIRARRYQVGR